MYSVYIYFQSYLYFYILTQPPKNIHKHHWRSFYTGLTERNNCGWFLLL